jgi:hypothetical protein
MKIEIKGFDYNDNGSGGIVHLLIDSNELDYVIHDCGEIDFVPWEVYNDFTEDEQDELTNFVMSSEEIEKEFPGDMFE